MLRVAVVGCGPGGVYSVGALVQHGDVAVDVLDRVPSPFGLVRYGVAPDHPKIQSISGALEKVLEHPAVRFLGNVEVGTHLRLDDLHRHYDGLIFANGASLDRRLSIPGEDLPGSTSATDFVSWYSGHPDTPAGRFSLDARRVAVIGMGNVALDVTRILAKSHDELRTTDLPDHVLQALAVSRVEDIHLIGRRGPAQARFTTKELRELGELAHADVLLDPHDLDMDEATAQRVADDAALRRNIDVLREWSTRSPGGRERRVHVRFMLRPVEILGDTHVTGLRLERTRLDANGNAVGTGEQSTLDTQLVLRSVGYRGLALAGMPFDTATGVIPNVGGRVLRDGGVAMGEYVAGWIKRGPTGVIGTNKHDANETVAALLADAPTLPRAPVRDPDAVLRLLHDRGVDVVTWEGWRAIQRTEARLGQAQGRARAKLADRESLLRAANEGVGHA
ncbi:MAG: ferredoxin/flavodoxin---NADP+ reductase [Actinomycetota bacterium]|jgi:ferredoxin--NADP+ reductase|nr:ferredoxin/flavodoxin---NADP+ reductase [Actinomycetota bacterium]